MEAKNRKEHGGWLIQKGKRFSIIAAIAENGDSPFFEYFSDLKKRLEELSGKSAELMNFRRLDHYFRRFSESGPWFINTQIKKLGGELFEFKIIETGLRVFFFYDPDNQAVIVLTHQFVKKQQRTKKEEIERAEKIRASFLRNR
ncbi:type II toxin-antitoxin system RelE/ParE family toxin [Leptospira johnsonii]|uniref:Gp49-like PF05973 family protein n=1 Tax=Leptospira johnsonii TaxID=1917820 RepID=A0A2P2D1J6_9LEPT|nr:type II toxin-antitoxin system RelE/ParE family toxin [Leptospira johnsonii]GBF38475.1 Gp49-like PF05973 family protein [Leptospira johnsonii]